MNTHTYVYIMNTHTYIYIYIYIFKHSYLVREHAQNTYCLSCLSVRCVTHHNESRHTCECIS